MNLNIAELAKNLTPPFYIYKEGLEAHILAFLSQRREARDNTQLLTKQHFFVGPDCVSKAQGQPKAPESGMIQVIYMEGVIGRKSDYWYGITGTKELIERLDAGNADTNVIAHMIVGASPGGSALPTREAAEAVANSTKPVGFFADEMMASAMYYIGCGASFIYAGKSSFVGSIGTVYRTTDFSTMFEKWGAKNLLIYGTESYDKDLGYQEALNGKPDKLRAALVDPFNELFLQHVKKYRPDAKDAALHGMMYLPEAALDMKLIDKVSTFEDALANLFDIASSNSNNSKTVKTNSQMKGKLISFLSFFGVVSATKAGTTEEKTEQELEQELTDKIKAQKDELTQKDEQINTLQADAKKAADTLKAEQDAHQKTKDALKAEQDAHKKTKDALIETNPAARTNELAAEKTDAEPKNNIVSVEDELALRADADDAAFWGRNRSLVKKD